MEENSDIFFAGGSVLGEPIHKKYSTTFYLGHPFSMYGSYDWFFNPLPVYALVHILDDPSLFPQLCKYLIDSLFLNQKTNKNIQISYSLKYRHSPH